MTLDPAKDNTLYQHSSSARSNGAGQYLFVGNTGSNSFRRGVIAFDMTEAIPPGSTLTSVTLTLKLSRTMNETQTITLHRLLSDWGEGTSDASGNEGSGTIATTGDATWLHRFFDSDQWDEPGGDFTAVASAGSPVSGSGEYTWGSTPEMVSDAQEWLDDPPNNFGWLLKGNEEDTQTTKRFDSRQNTVQENRPLLTVEYLPQEGP